MNKTVRRNSMNHMKRAVQKRYGKLSYFATGGNGWRYFIVSGFHSEPSVKQVIECETEDEYQAIKKVYKIATRGIVNERYVR